MKINNSLETGKYKLYFALSFLVFVISIAFIFIEGFNVIYLIIGLLGLGVYIFLWLKNPYYINFETTHKDIIFRFYSAHPIFKKPKVYQIPLHNFNGYEIKKKGLGKKIIFSIKKGKKVGSYPPVSISIVPKKMLEEMEKELKTILKIKSLK